MSTKTKTDREQAYETILDLILNMQLKPGETVTEIALAERLDMGRTPVREALKKLEDDGLIITNNGRKRVYVLTLKEVAEIFDLKICLEGAVAKWAAKRAGQEDLKALEATLKKMKHISEQTVRTDEEREARLQQWLKQDQQLHRCIFKMADNQRAQRVIEGLNRQWHRLRIGIYTLQGRIERSYVEHENVVIPILEQDATAAAAAMKSHLSNVKRELLQILEVFRYPAD